MTDFDWINEGRDEHRKNVRSSLSAVLDLLRAGVNVVGEGPAGFTTQIVDFNIALIRVTNTVGIENVVVLTMPEDQGSRSAHLSWAGSGDANVSIELALPYWMEDNAPTVDSLTWALCLLFPGILTE